jgi:Flp pilus assembly CpaF family ATPase
VVIEQGAELRLDTLRPVTVERDGQLVQVMEPWVEWELALATTASALGGPTDEIITMGDLMRHALRLTPDILVLGEARGQECYDCLGVMATGHEGSMMTIHANSVEGVRDRLVTLVMEHPVSGQSEAFANRIVRDSAEVLIHLRRDFDGVRRLTGIGCLDAGGNVQWIYRRDDKRVLRRVTRSVREIHKIADRMEGAFPGDEWPEV